MKCLATAMLCLLAVGHATAALATATDPAATNDPRAELEHAASVWASHPLPSDRYKARDWGDFGGHVITVVVRNGRCVKAYYWRHLRTHPASCESRTVEELLTEMRRLIEAKPLHFEASYDPIRGFPTHLFVTPGDGLTDQDWSYDIEYSHPLD